MYLTVKIDRLLPERWIAARRSAVRVLTPIPDEVCSNSTYAMPENRLTQQPGLRVLVNCQRGVNGKRTLLLEFKLNPRASKDPRTRIKLTSSPENIFRMSYRRVKAAKANTSCRSAQPFYIFSTGQIDVSHLDIRS